MFDLIKLLIVCCIVVFCLVIADTFADFINDKVCDAPIESTYDYNWEGD